MQSQQHENESILDLIDDALAFVDAHTLASLTAIIERVRPQILGAMHDPADKMAIMALRGTAQELWMVASQCGYQPGRELSDALDALSCRLLVRARVACAEWDRALACQQAAHTLLAQASV
jgi:hypothetical protein